MVKTFTKTSQEEIDFKESAQLSDLLDKIADKYGKPFSQEVYDPDQERNEINLRGHGKRHPYGPTKRHQHTPKRRRQHNFNVSYDGRIKS